MNSMMNRLSAFANYQEAESYLREHSSWDFDNPTVKDFLRVIKRGLSNHSIEHGNGKTVCGAHTGRQFGRHHVEGTQSAEGV